MKKSSFTPALLLVLAAFFSCATLAQAQTAGARYHHDNFDIAGGVQITPEPTPAPPAAAPGKAKRGARPLTDLPHPLEHRYAS